MKRARPKFLSTSYHAYERILVELCIGGEQLFSDVSDETVLTMKRSHDLRKATDDTVVVRMDADSIWTGAQGLSARVCEKSIPGAGRKIQQIMLFSEIAGDPKIARFGSMLGRSPSRSSRCARKSNPLEVQGRAAAPSMYVPACRLRRT